MTKRTVAASAVLAMLSAMLCAAFPASVHGQTQTTSGSKPPAASPPSAAVQPNPSTIDGTKYVRIHVELTVSGETSDHITFGECPDRPLFGLDVSDLVGGEDYEGSIGVTVTAPDGFNVMLTPIAVTRTDGVLLWGRNCNVSVDRIKFDSPVVYANGFANQNFHIAPLVTRIKSLDGSAIAATDAVLGVVQPLLGVTTIVASAVQSKADSLMANLKISAKEQQGANLTITPGAAPASTSFDIPGVLAGLKKAVKIEATLVPAELIADPGRDWTPPDVLGAPFPMNPNTNAGQSGISLRQYINTRFNANISNLTKNGTTIDGAAAACAPVAADIASMGLSPRDNALSLWATVIESVPALSANPAIDHIGCINLVASDLPAHVIRSVAPTPTTGAPPTVAQMKGAASNITDFFRSAAWADKDAAGSVLFAPQVSVSDPNQVLLQGTTTLKSNSDWLALPLNENQTAGQVILSHVGCFVYIPLVAGQPNFASQLGAKSIMLAMGALRDGKEVALVFSFAPFTADPAKIDQISVTTTLNATAKALLTSAWQAQGQCGTDNPWKPKLLFGG